MPVGGSYPKLGSGYDLVYFYPVFSHLSETNAKNVLSITWEALKPNGLVALTSLRPAHIDIWYSHRETANYAPIMKQVGFDRIDWWERTSEGTYLYMPLGGGDPSRPPHDYGEAIVPKDWWQALDGYRLVAFLRDTGLPQAYVKSQKIATMNCRKNHCS